MQTIAVLICWDEWFPEPARIVAMKGADIIFYPSAIGSLPEEPDFDCSPMWIDAIKAHGIHNNVFTAAINRVGIEYSSEGFMSFYGCSFASNPLGEIIAKSKTAEDEIIYADVDFSEVKRARDFMQFFRDRRPETYEELLKLTIEG